MLLVDSSFAAKDMLGMPAVRTAAAKKIEPWHFQQAFGVVRGGLEFRGFQAFLGVPPVCHPFLVFVAGLGGVQGDTNPCCRFPSGFEWLEPRDEADLCSPLDHRFAFVPTAHSRSMRENSAVVLVAVMIVTVGGCDGCSMAARIRAEAGPIRIAGPKKENQWRPGLLCASRK